MIKYFCDYCGEEITNVDDLQRLTSQDPSGNKKAMHFHCRKCYDAWYEKAFGGSLKTGVFGENIKVVKQVPDDVEEMKIGSFIWSIKPYRVTRRTTRTLLEVQRIIACAYLYSNKEAAVKCHIQPYDVPNTLNRWGEPVLKDVYLKLAYATHKVGNTSFDWKKVLTLLAGGWSVEQIADEFSGATTDEVKRVIAIFTGVKEGDGETNEAGKLFESFKGDK